MRIKRNIILLSLPCFLSLFSLMSYAGYTLKPPACLWENRAGFSDKAENIYYCDINKRYAFGKMATHWVKLNCGAGDSKKFSKDFKGCHIETHHAELKHTKSLRAYEEVGATTGYSKGFSATNWSNHTQHLTVERIYCQLERKTCDNKDKNCHNLPCLRYGDRPVPDKR